MNIKLFLEGEVDFSLVISENISICIDGG